MEYTEMHLTSYNDDMSYFDKITLIEDTFNLNFVYSCSKIVEYKWYIRIVSYSFRYKQNESIKEI